MIVDPARVTEIIRETAELDVLPRFRKLAESEIMEKAPGDIVTVADYEAEERLSRGLKAIMPNAHILAEEAASRDGLELDDHHTEDATWLIDPVDGTRNFSKGETAFAIVVAFVTGGQVEQSWIHLPVSDETLVAERGCGAYTQDGTRLTAAQSAELSNMRGLVNFRGLGDDVPWEQVKARADTFSEVKNFRCAGFDFVQLAKGKKHFSLYRRLWPWDHAAGTLIFNEAGGHVARVDGKAYRPLERVWGLLCAPSAEAWQDIHDHLATPD